MCECGCGELNPVAKLPAGDGAWFLLEVYPGCRDCGTSWGLGVTLMAESDDSWEFVVRTPTVEFGKFGQWGAPILDTAILRAEFAKEEGGDDELGDANFALSEFVSRGGLRTVYHATRRKAEAYYMEPPK